MPHVAENTVCVDVASVSCCGVGGVACASGAGRLGVRDFTQACVDLLGVAAMSGVSDVVVVARWCSREASVATVCWYSRRAKLMASVTTRLESPVVCLVWTTCVSIRSLSRHSPKPGVSSSVICWDPSSSASLLSIIAPSCAVSAAKSTSVHLSESVMYRRCAADRCERAWWDIAGLVQLGSAGLNPLRNEQVSARVAPTQMYVRVVSMSACAMRVCVTSRRSLPSHTYSVT